MKTGPAKIGSILALALLAAGCAGRHGYDPEATNAYGDYLTAVYARSTGDPARASRAYLELLAKEPGNLALLEGAYSFFVFNGDIAHALDTAGRLNALDPDHVPTGMLLTLEAYLARDDNRMESHLVRVKGFGFDNLMAPILRGWVLAREGRGEEALQTLAPLSKVKRFEPYYVEHRALILDYLGRTGEAEAGYRAILSRESPGSATPVLALAALLQRKGEGAEARRLLADVGGRFPGEVEIAAARSALARGEKLGSAAANPDRALALAFLRLGKEFGRDRAFLPAVVYGRFALYLDPALDEARLFLGNLLLNQRYPDLALDAYNAVAADGVYGEAAARSRTYALNALGRLEEALAAAETLAQREPPSLEALTALGDLYRDRERYADALSAYERAISARGELGPDNWFLLYSRSVCLERLGRFDEAEADLRRVLAFRPDEPDVLNYLGYMWVDRGVNFAEARALIEKAVKLAPDNGAFLDSLGWAEYRTGEFEAAVETLEKAVALEPGDPVMNDHLGDAYWKAGREREAAFQWNRALVFGPTDDERTRIEAKLASGLPDADGRGE